MIPIIMASFDASFSHIQSERTLPGWTVSVPHKRKVLQPRGVTACKYVQTHSEPKSKELRSGVVRKIAPYKNDLMSPWQHDLSKIINQGNNVIVDSVTSTGKTWAANLIVAHETLERDSRARALIISPNSEVMRDTACTIGSFHNKIYKYSGSVMSTMTRNYITYDERGCPSGQIMIVTVDSAVEFLTDPKNRTFVEWLRFVVFDEVHLKWVAETLWWTQFIPHQAQLILLSATLGNPEDVSKIVQRMQVLQKDRPRKTEIISYYVRPIPLQLVMFKGCEMPTDIISKDLKSSGRLACAISTDPTTRDISSICPGIMIPEDREAQYRLGQETLMKYPEIVKQKNEQAMKDITTDPTPENILKVLCYLFSNEMQPVMVFHTTTEQTRFACDQLIGLLNRIEMEDPELKEARRECERYDREMLRARDKKDLSKGGKSREKDMSKWERAMPAEPAAAADIARMRRKLAKWSFPCELTEEEIPKNMEAWIAACMERGIGVYVSTMPVWLRHFTFDAFRDGKIKVLFSDSTISVGINLPIRTCVLCGHIPHHLYKQASGRAGRRGMDTKGFIVHMMPEDRIRKYISERTVDMEILMPKEMTYSSLIRLQIPANLDCTQIDTTSKGKGRDEWAKPNPAAVSEPVAEFRRQILLNYIDSLEESSRLKLHGQLALINKEVWAYHRLTNFIKTLPCSESILIIKLLTMGILHKFEPFEFIDLVSMLLYRDEGSNTSNTSKTEDEAASSYYVPEFPRFPGLKSDLKTYAAHYGFEIDLDRPIHHYFSQFCQGRQYLTHMDNIQDIGEWLYIFKRGVMDIGPKDEIQLPKEHDYDDFKYRTEYLDDFVKMVMKVDSIYTSSITRKKTYED